VTLAVEMEELSDAALTDLIAGAARRGAAVGVVLPAAGRSAATNAAAALLAAAGAQVRYLASPVLHAKAIVADGRRSYVGSANLTTASLDANREVGLALDDPATARLLGEAIALDLARGATEPP